MTTILLLVVFVGPRIVGLLLAERAPRWVWIVSLSCIPLWLALLAEDGARHVKAGDTLGTWGQFLGVAAGGVIAVLAARHDWARLNGRRWPAPL